MRVNAIGSDAAARAALCAAALALAALVQGCAPRSAPPGGETAPQTQALLAQSTPVQLATPAPPVKSPLPTPKGFVNDSARVIDDLAESLLEAKLRDLKARSKIEIGVATVETTGDQSIFDYSLAVARGWGIGPPAGQEGGGVLLLLAVNDRKWQIQVSRGLEADLPDDVADEIGRGMSESLRARRYDEAVHKCVDGLIKRLAERRGFSMKDEELILQGLPEETPKPAERPKAGERRKSEPQALTRKP
jgi:uncharacterized membrane protein YgcG